MPRYIKGHGTFQLIQGVNISHKEYTLRGCLAMVRLYLKIGILNAREYKISMFLGMHVNFPGPSQT